ncbi:hypothetical protein PULV_a2472 [Pseudoalteromonas ulvae UL12]|uniref:YggN family protein n=1 Tax=Pseudoalteromonas ulvae TaxID=107327 RepID=UPI0019F78B20|nr:YggN family protein [Pseudoalteromonas ulvae]MBE0364718.1 hypothetical protein [Pseudoalteromonas ulvae UL12]
MMKSIILLSSALMVGPAMAHSNVDGLTVSSESCNIDIQQTLKISPNILEIENNDHQVMQIDQQGRLFINQQEVDVTSAQQTMLMQYADGLRANMPQVAEIALEGVKIAGIALDEVGTAFGLHNTDSMTRLMDEVSVKINESFYQDGSFVIDQSNFTNIENHFDEQFDQEIERAMEEAVMNSIGSLLVSLGSELLGAGGNMEEFENRMTRMGEQIELKVEAQAHQLEARADALCGSIEQLAQTEKTLQQSLPILKGYDLFAANHH